MAANPMALTFRRTAPNSATCKAMTELLVDHMAIHHAAARIDAAHDAGPNRPWILPADTLCFVASPSNTTPGNPDETAKQKAAVEVEDGEVADETVCAMICILTHDGNTPASRGLPVDQKTGEIKRVIVRPGFRRMGIGSSLNAYVEEQVRLAGFTYLVCETLLSETNAQKFYVRNGWKERSVFGTYDPDQSVVYEKWLEP